MAVYWGGNFKVSVCCWGLACPWTTWINRLFILWNQSGSVASPNRLCSCRTETKPTRNKSKELKLKNAYQSAIVIHAALSSLQRQISPVFGALLDTASGSRELASNRNEKILHFSVVISLYTAPAPFSPPAPSSHLQSMLQPASYSLTELRRRSSHVSLWCKWDKISSVLQNWTRWRQTQSTASLH